MNGNGEVLEALRGMWGEMKTLNGRVNGTNERLDRGFAELRGEVAELRGAVGELRGDVQVLGRRIDNVLLGAHGDEHAELRARVVRLEQHVGLAPAPTR